MGERQVKSRERSKFNKLLGASAVWQDTESSKPSILFNQLQLENAASQMNCETEFHRFLEWQTDKRDYILGQGAHETPVKEESYKGDFLQQIFVHCLGFKLHKNLIPESMNETDAGTADAAYQNEKGTFPLVIEIKDVRTKIDEKGNDSLVDQAFGYKNKRTGCSYVITCNFANLRLYIEDDTRWIQFNLLYDGWTYSDFQKFYFCCCEKSISQNKPKYLSEQSSVAEKNITNELYQEYRVFRAELIADIIKNNPDLPQTHALEASQKLLDRFFFIFYAEDRGLIPIMTIQNHIIKKYSDVKSNSVFTGLQVSLYQICRTYFEFINSGYDVDPDIYPAYNGGLFAKDDKLDNLVISDDVLEKHISEITQFDFSEHGIGLQVLGHIFEQTLKDLDDVQGKAQNNALTEKWLLHEHIKQNAQKGKQKNSTKSANGVVYTPEYITKHIIQNSLGRLCSEQWLALGIDEIHKDYQRACAIIQIWLDSKESDGKSKANTEVIREELRGLMKKYQIRVLDKSRQKVVIDCDKTLSNDTSKSNIEKIQYEFAAFGRKHVLEYRHFLEELKICDPAVGSGAFLISVLEYLKNEYKRVVEYMRYFGESLPLRDIDAFILQNNLYGVDILEGAVSICRLSLWLNTARQEHKLNKLSERIKCGDSLMTDAFDWKMEFPEVFDRENPGFDVVIANPPYVHLQDVKEYSAKLRDAGYETYHANGDLYCLFTERIYRDLLRQGGYASMIMQNHWMITDYGAPLRRFLSKTRVHEILNFGDMQFFEGVTTYVCIFTLQKTESTGNTCMYSTHRKIYNSDGITNPADVLKLELEKNSFVRSQQELTEAPWILCKSQKERELWRQLKQYPTLEDVLDINNDINYGIKTGCNEAFYIDDKKRREIVAKDPRSAEIIAKRIVGDDVEDWATVVNNQWMINSHNGIKSEQLPPILIENYPAVKAHLDQYYPTLQKRCDKGNTPYNLRNCAYLKAFSKPKIIYPNMTSQFPFMYSEEEVYANQKCFIITKENSDIPNILFILTAIFNSSLAKRWIWFYCPEIQGGTREISLIYFRLFPLPKCLSEKYDSLDELTRNSLSSLANLAKQRYEITLQMRQNIADFQLLMRDNLDFSIIYSGKSQDAIEKRAKRVLPTALTDFWKLEFPDFIKAAHIPMDKQNEWRGLFEQNQMSVLQCQAKCGRLDEEIEKSVYALYGIGDARELILAALKANHISVYA